MAALAQNAPTAALPAAAASAGLPFGALWRWVTLLTVFVAFLAIFLTGELRPEASALFMAGWLGACALAGRAAAWPRWIGFAVTALAVAAIVFLAQFGYFTSILYLLLYLVLVKCYAMRSPRDYLQVQLLCFFMILSTAVITVSFYFSFVYLAYLLLATLALMLYAIAKAGGLEVEPVRSGAASERIPGRLALSAPAGGLVLLVLVAFVFLAIPHVSYQQLNSPMSTRGIPAERLTGFSEEVTLGTFKTITPDPTVVMRVELSWPEGASTQRPSELRLRGVALDTYEQNRWRRSSLDPEAVSVRAYRQLDLKLVSAQRGPIIHQKIYQNPDVTMRTFAATHPLAIDLQRNMRVRYDLSARTAQVVGVGGSGEGSYTNPFVYWATSTAVSEATPMLQQFTAKQGELTEARGAILAQMREPEAQRGMRARARRFRRSGAGAGNELPWLAAGLGYSLEPPQRLINTALPETGLVARIGALSRERAPGPTDAEIILQATTYLRENFAYTLDPGTPEGMDPIDAFLFETKKGHCEYFATALALMLRTRGIPARLVNGFYTSEWNDLAGVFIAKQSDAHAWVEAWHDDLGWLTVDPTPPGNAGRAAYGAETLTEARRWVEFFRVQWQRLVIDYSQERQAALLDRARERIAETAPARAAAEVFANLRDRLAGAAEADDDRQNDDRSVAIAFGAAAALAALAAAFGLLRMRARTRAADSAALPTVDFLQELLERLARAGLKRPAGRTVAEFAGELKLEPPARKDLDWLVELYYREQFAGAPASPEDRARARRVAAELQLQSP